MSCNFYCQSMCIPLPWIPCVSGNSRIDLCAGRLAQEVNRSSLPSDGKDWVVAELYEALAHQGEQPILW